MLEDSLDVGHLLDVLVSFDVEEIFQALDFPSDALNLDEAHDVLVLGIESFQF